MICPPSHVSPASSFCHPLTAPASTQIMFLYPSAGAKSDMLTASVQGFQTTTSLRLSRTMLNFFAPPSVTTTGALGPPAGVYTRSVLEAMVRALEGDVVVEMGVVSLST